MPTAFVLNPYDGGRKRYKRRKRRNPGTSKGVEKSWTNKANAASGYPGGRYAKYGGKKSATPGHRKGIREAHEAGYTLSKLRKRRPKGLPKFVLDLLGPPKKRKRKRAASKTTRRAKTRKNVYYEKRKKPNKPAPKHSVGAKVKWAERYIPQITWYSLVKEFGIRGAKPVYDRLIDQGTEISYSADSKRGKQEMAKRKARRRRPNARRKTTSRSRSAAAKKAAATRRRNKAKRVAAGKKAARTRRRRATARKAPTRRRRRRNPMASSAAPRRRRRKRRANPPIRRRRRNSTKKGGDRITARKAYRPEPSSSEGRSEA